MNNIEDRWKQIKIIMQDMATNTKTTDKRNQKWIINEIFGLMDERRKHKNSLLNIIARSNQ